MSNEMAAFFLCLLLGAQLVALCFQAISVAVFAVFVIRTLIRTKGVA
jgi:hypothetical protein